MQTLLDELKDEIFKKRPVLKEIYAKYKDLTLSEFTNLQFKVNDNPDLSPDRKEEAIKAISEQAGKLLGPEVEKNVASQLGKEYNAVTADHHGPITHPDFVSSNLLSSFNFINNSQDRGSIIVLSCANVSFDNFTFPRGHLFHSFTGDEPVKLKLPFFPYKVHSYSVFGHPGFTGENLKFTNQRLDEWLTEGQIDIARKEKLSELVNNIYSKPEVLARDYYSEQVTLTNFDLWRNLFAGQENAPDLIYIELESLVNSILLKHHLDEDTLIHNILFKENYNRALMKYFDGVDSAFDLKQKLGTFLFWGLPKDQKYRVQLWKEGDRLVSPDGSFSIEFTPEGIRRAIKAKELIPSTLLSFTILSFYYGLTLIGGGGQTTYLTQMKAAFLKMCEELGDSESADICNDIATDKLSFLYPGTVFIKDKSGNLIPASLLDIILYSGTEATQVIGEMAGKVTFEQAFLRSLPYLYGLIFPKDMQKEELLKITAESIDKQTGFEAIARPVGTV